MVYTETPKNSTSDYKTSPSSSPSKKTSGSLLYKDGVSTLRGGDHNHRHLHHNQHHHRSKTDSEDDYLYKFKGFCSWKVATIVISILFVVSLACAILLGTYLLTHPCLLTCQLDFLGTFPTKFVFFFFVQHRNRCYPMDRW